MGVMGILSRDRQNNAFRWLLIGGKRNSSERRGYAAARGEGSGFDVIDSFSMLQPEDRLRSSLSSIHDAVKAAPINHDVNHRGF